MKPTIAISVWVLAAGLAVAQNPSVIQNTRATMNGVSATTAAASNSALKTPLPQTATGQSAATSVAHPKRHHGSGTHAKKTASAPKVEKAAATKVEPASEKVRLSICQRRHTPPPGRPLPHCWRVPDPARRGRFSGGALGLSQHGAHLAGDTADEPNCCCV